MSEISRGVNDNPGVSAYVMFFLFLFVSFIHLSFLFLSPSSLLHFIALYSFMFSFTSPCVGADVDTLHARKTRESRLSACLRVCRTLLAGEERPRLG